MRSGTTQSADRWHIGGPQDIFFGRDAAVPLPTIVRGDGPFVWDDAGDRYLDASSGPVVNNLGHRNPRVLAAIREQADRMCFSSSQQTRTNENIDAARKLALHAGPGYERAFLVSGGSEAVDMALKFARQLALARGERARTRIISCTPSYHGATIAAAAISGDRTTDAILDGMAAASARVAAPLTYRVPPGHSAESHAAECAAALEREIVALGPERVLAFVFEPIGGLATGANVAPDPWYHEVRRICSTYGLLLIHDEVLCGAGRSGQFLASHHWPDAMPDIVVQAKGLSAGYTPFGAVMAPAGLVEEVADRTGFHFSHTYTANPLSCRIVSAVLDEIDRLDLVRAAHDRGATLRSRLEDLMERSPVVGDVRGRGLLLAIELVADRETKARFQDVVAANLVRTVGLRHGLLLYSRRMNDGAFGEWVMVAPPLTITDDELDELVTRLEDTLDEFAREAMARR